MQARRRVNESQHTPRRHPAARRPRLGQALDETIDREATKGAPAPQPNGDHFPRRPAYSICCISLRDCRGKARGWRRSSMASRVDGPCVSAFLLPRGAPAPGAPPCIRQRFLPRTAGARQGAPEPSCPAATARPHAVAIAASTILRCLFSRAAAQSRHAAVPG